MHMAAEFTDGLRIPPNLKGKKSITTTFSLHHILFPHPGLYPLSSPHLPLSPQGVNVKLGPNQNDLPTPPPLILASGSSNTMEYIFFNFEDFF